MKSSKKNRILNEAGILPENLDLNDEFLNAFNTIENTDNCIFVTGKAGTGKSTLLKYFKKNTLKNVVVLAPTGVAAINAGGQTIHSFFRLPPRLIQKADIRRRRDSEIIQNLNAVIIDEISMVRADLMDGIDYALRINRDMMNVPFGGIQIILFGDLFQLPPVVNKEMKEILKNKYNSPYFFNAAAFKEIELKYIELTNVYRQKDRKFVILLNKIRNKTQTEEELELLNKRAGERISQKKEHYVTLTTTNHRANSINEKRLVELSGKERIYEANTEGDFDERTYPTEYYLKIKEGAQVILIRNDLDKRWVNGTIARVTTAAHNSIKVLIDGNIYEVLKLEWKKIEYKYNAKKDKIETRTIGTFEQYPIKLAWAITIHKSQGQTFDNVVIDLSNGAFTHGQVYVALSRCASLGGITLKRPVIESDIIFDERIYDFRNRLSMA